MFSKLFKPKDPITDFWRWFQANDAALLQLMPENTVLWRQLRQKLKAIDPSLTFEMDVADLPPREFIVSADGIKGAFPAVKGVVAAAPSLSNWTLFAFRQPGKDFPYIDLDGSRLDADSIFYIAHKTADQLHLEIFIDGLTEANRPQITRMTFLIFDSWFGEYDVESKLILGEDFQPLNAGVTGLKPMAALRDEMNGVPGLKL